MTFRFEDPLGFASANMTMIEILDAKPPSDVAASLSMLLVGERSWWEEVHMYIARIT
jgi:hypothetical protein